MTTTDPYDPMQRIAERLEAIDATLGLVLQTLQQINQNMFPPRLAGDPTQLDAGIPTEAEPRTVTSTDASWVFLNSTHKRRQGDKLFQSTAPPQRLGNPQAQLNPYFRRVPAIREEERHGETTDPQPRE
ncbi:MAG TPA: hypothetical protein VKP67_23270 [Xanthobacteraceae bacterium]|nr:hypothetical protein [Xanthobacteraceae bacterium]